MQIENNAVKSYIHTFTLMEYWTKGSKEVTLRWRTVRRSVWKPETNFDNCLGFFFVRIRRLAWVSIKVTSTSATGAFKVHLLPTNEKVCSESEGNSVNDGVNSVLLCVVLGAVSPCSESIPVFCRKFSFWISRECTRCSSSFTNSMAPPTTEAWSPCTKNIEWLNADVISTNPVSSLRKLLRDRIFEPTYRSWLINDFLIDYSVDFWLVC